MVVAVGLGVAENDAGSDLGGRRSSGEVEPVARGTTRGMRWCYGLLGMR